MQTFFETISSPIENLGMLTDKLSIVSTIVVKNQLRALRKYSRYTIQHDFLFNVIIFILHGLHSQDLKINTNL